MEPWVLNISNISLGGLTTNYFDSDYPSVGAINQAGFEFAMDLTSPHFMVQGPGPREYLRGTQDANGIVTTTIRGMLQNPYKSTNRSLAVGGDKLYLLSAGSVSSPTIVSGSYGGTTFPHTITHPSANLTEESWGIIEYKGSVFYSYNLSTAYGDIGKYNGASVDDDWFSVSASGGQYLMGKLSGDIIHPMEVGGDTLYVGNHDFVASWDGSTAITGALDLPQGFSVRDLKWVNDRLVVAARYMPSNLASIKTGRSSVFIWDGTTTSWETEIPVRGQVGAGYVVNGQYFQFYEDKSNSYGPYSIFNQALGGGYSRKYYLTQLDGSTLKNLVTIEGDCPEFYQVTDFQNFLAWTDNYNQSVMMYGPLDGSSQPRLFSYAAVYSNVMGGISTSPPNAGLSVGYDGGVYKTLNYFLPTSYDTYGEWQSLMFDIGSATNSQGKIDSVRFDFEPLVSGSSVDVQLLNANGGTIFSDTISYARAVLGDANHSKTHSLYNFNGINSDSLAVKLTFQSGSSTGPVKIKNIKINGRN